MKERKKADDIVHCTVHSYQLKEEGQQGLNNMSARKSLSVFAYNTLYSRAAKYASFLTSETQDNESVKIWPAQYDPAITQTVTIKMNE